MPHLHRTAEQSTAGRRLETGTGNTDTRTRGRVQGRAPCSLLSPHSRWSPQSAHCPVSRCPAQPGAGGQGRTRARLYLYFAGVWARPSAQQLHCCPTLIWAEQLFMFRKILRSQNCAAAACCLALQLQVTEPRLFSTFILLLVKTSRDTGEKYYSRDLLFQLCLWIHISLAGLFGWLDSKKQDLPAHLPTPQINLKDLYCSVHA